MLLVGHRRDHHASARRRPEAGRRRRLVSKHAHSFSGAVRRANSQSGISIIEHRVPKGNSPPLHVHRNEDEASGPCDRLIALHIFDRAIIVF